MPQENNAETKLLRLGQMLRIFMENETVSSTGLSRHFRTTPRTIQRDLLLLRKSGFPVHETGKGTYRLRKDLVKNLEVFDDFELALVVAMKNVVGQLGQLFQKAADAVLERLCDCTAAMPVFIKIDEALPLDRTLANRLMKAIREKRQVEFQYAAGRGGHGVRLDPYRVACFSGFWYLIGNEPASGIIKRYALDQLTQLKLTRDRFKKIPDHLDAVLQNSGNIWFAPERHLEVTVRVDASVSHYFKRRRMFPTQEIREEAPDGSLVVSFQVGQYEAVRHLLKSWIPHIVILSPEDFKAQMLDDMRNWIARHQGCGENEGNANG